MKLGEKIKNFRKLRGLTQTELGLKIGFKESTADVRINQYETNKMAPKNKIRTAIADALQIDIAFLNDNNLSENILISLFELQQLLKFDVKLVNDHITLEIPTLPFNDELNEKLRKWAELNRKYGSVALLELDSEKKKNYINEFINSNK